MSHVERLVHLIRARDRDLAAIRHRERCLRPAEVFGIDDGLALHEDLLELGDAVLESLLHLYALARGRDRDTLKLRVQFVRSRLWWIH